MTNSCPRRGCIRTPAWFDWRRTWQNTFFSVVFQDPLTPISSNLFYQDFYRQHMLSDTLLVPRLVLPYLDQCVRQAKLLCHR